jgi:hypothetical protein
MTHKCVSLTIDENEQRMLLLLAAKYKGPNSFSQTIRHAFVNECVRYGLDIKAMVRDDAETVIK